MRFFKCDVTKAEELFGVFNKVKEDHEYIDIVVNNAGVADESNDRFKLEIEVNFVSKSLNVILQEVQKTLCTETEFSR